MRIDENELMRSIFIDDVFLEVSCNEVGVLFYSIDEESVEGDGNLLLHAAVLASKGLLPLSQPLFRYIFPSIYLF